MFPLVSEQRVTGYVRTNNVRTPFYFAECRPRLLSNGYPAHCFSGESNPSLPVPGRGPGGCWRLPAVPAATHTPYISGTFCRMVSNIHGLRPRIRGNNVGFACFATDTEVQRSCETVWTTQKNMGEIFGTSRENISIHLKNIFEDEELSEKVVSKEILHTAQDGKKYKTRFFNLDAIISVGYRVNSYQATRFRVWATKVLKEYLIKGFAN